MSLTNTQKEANQALYLSARAAFVGQGTTLNAWCRANAIHLQNVRSAFLGDWQGDGADKLIKRVLTAAGCEG